MPRADAGKRVACLRLSRNIEDAGLEAGDRFVAKQQVVFRRDYSPVYPPISRRTPRPRMIERCSSRCSITPIRRSLA